MAEKLSFDGEPPRFLRGNANLAATGRPNIDALSAQPTDNRLNQQVAANRIRERASDALEDGRAAKDQVRSQASLRADLVKQTEQNLGDRELRTRNGTGAVLDDRDIEQAAADRAEQVKQSDALVQRRIDRSERTREIFVQQVRAQRNSEQNIERASLDPSAPRGSIVDFQA